MLDQSSDDLGLEVLSQNLSEGLAANKRLFGDWVHLSLVFLERHIQVLDVLRFEGGHPVDQSNGVLHPSKSTGGTRRTKLEDSRVFTEQL